jgi:hypothetical protein
MAFGRRRQSRVRTPFVLPRFTGLHDDADNSHLADSDLREANNVYLEGNHLLRSRLGTDLDPIDPTGSALNGGTPITGIFDCIVKNESVHETIWVAGNKIYEEETADPSTMTDITGLTVPVAGKDNVFTGAIFEDSLYLASTQIVPQKVTLGAGPSTVADVSNWLSTGTAPKPGLVFTKWQYLFFAGFFSTTDTGNGYHPMSVMHGELNADDAWFDGNRVDKIGGLSTFGDEYVTALFEHRDFLMIGTNRSIYPVTYTGNNFGRFAIQRRINVGVAHQRAVASINGEFTIFMSPNGDIHTIREVAETFGGLGVSRPLSEKVRNYVRDLNPGRIRYTIAEFWNEYGWVVFAVSKGAIQSTNNELLILDLNDFPLDDPDPQRASWWRWKSDAGWDFNSMALLRRDGQTASSASVTSDKSTTGREVLFCGSTTGWPRKFSDEFSYDETEAGVDTNIVTDVLTKYWDFGEPSSEKSVVEMQWAMEPSSTDDGPVATILYDYGQGTSGSRQINMDTNLGAEYLLGTTFIWGTATWGSDEGAVAQSKDYFEEAGTFAALKLRQSLSGTIKWKLQRAVATVEKRGEVPEAIT